MGIEHRQRSRRRGGILVRNNDAVMVTCVLCHSSSFCKDIDLYFSIMHYLDNILDEYENLSLEIRG